MCRIRQALSELVGRPVSSDLSILMLDGFILAEQTCAVARSRSRRKARRCCSASVKGRKQAGLRLGPGRPEDQAAEDLLVVIDSSNALRKAIGDASGERPACIAAGPGPLCRLRLRTVLPGW